MQKLLIIQQDDAYFLFETLQVLSQYSQSLKNFSLTLLVSPDAYEAIKATCQLPTVNIVFDAHQLEDVPFDLSVNFSLNEASWPLHSQIKSQKKIGFQQNDSSILVPDLWSSYLLTIKARAPFLTFHLRDIYKNILGLKAFHESQEVVKNVSQIAFGLSSTDLFPAQEQENFICEILKAFPHLPIIDLSEVNIEQDASKTLYIGPSSLDALELCQRGGSAILLSAHFQGFNFIPHQEGNYLITSSGKPFEANKLCSLVQQIFNKQSHINSEFSVYQVEHENIFGAYLKSLNHSDDHYPFYQSHVVLWNFLLNLFDTNLEITKCSDSQVSLLKTYQVILSKMLRLHDYAMVSMDTVYRESKAVNANQDTIQGHLKNLREIEQLSNQMAESHALLRPVLDFYRIRRGQVDGDTFLEQSQSSYLTYTEEHQALQALHELFSVTLTKNEANI